MIAMLQINAIIATTHNVAAPRSRRIGGTSTPLAAVSAPAVADDALPLPALLR
jgi:hypothetical protein